MNIRNEVNDSTVLVGTEVIVRGAVLELDENGNHVTLTDASKADAILLKKTTPTENGVNAPIVVGGIVESPEKLILPDGITLKDIKPVLRGKGIYLRGVK